MNSQVRLQDIAGEASKIAAGFPAEFLHRVRAEHAVALELRLGEKLVSGALVRKCFAPLKVFVDIARLITDGYLDGSFSGVDIVYSQFVSTLVQRPIADELLPITAKPDTEGIPGNQFIFEPNPATVLERLLPRYVATRLFQAALETTASFFSSQMVAMKNATENAEELIEDLTLEYNKVRQSNITREMIEIASGAQAG